MTAMYAEVLADLGVRNILACGYVGGISASSPIGSYGLVTKASGLDGTTRAYSPRRSTFAADEHLVSRIREELDQRDAEYEMGSAASLDALLLEDDAMIQGFRQQGHCFVDLETACLFALGSLRKINVAALHVVTDNPTSKTIDWDKAHEASFGEQMQIALSVLSSLHESFPTEEDSAS